MKMTSLSMNSTIGRTLAMLLISGGSALASPAAAGTASVEERLRALEDRQQIDDLMTRYALGLDTLDPILYGSVFTEDATLDIAGLPYRGRAAIVAWIESMNSPNMAAPRGLDARGYRFGPIRHVITNLQLKIGGSKATAESYFIEIASNGRDERGHGRPQRIINVGRYQDDLVKRAGKWLISKRVIIADMYAPIPFVIDMSIFPQAAAPSTISR